MKNSNLRKITLGALMLALSVLLSMITFFRAPYGGSVTPGCMVPILLFAIVVKNPKWGLLEGLASGLLQLLLGLSAIAGISLLSWFGAAFLDYIVAFSVFGLAGLIAARFRSLPVGTGVAAFVCCMLRFGCHFLSGMLIWGEYAPEGQPVWLYSLLYNGGYMLFETLVTVAFAVLLAIFLPWKKMRLQ